MHPETHRILEHYCCVSASRRTHLGRQALQRTAQTVEMTNGHPEEARSPPFLPIKHLIIWSSTKTSNFNQKPRIVLPPRALNSSTICWFVRTPFANKPSLSNFLSLEDKCCGIHHNSFEKRVPWLTSKYTSPVCNYWGLRNRERNGTASDSTLLRAVDASRAERDVWTLFFNHETISIACRQSACFLALLCHQ